MKKVHQTEFDGQLPEVLKECRAYARRGRKFSEETLAGLETFLSPVKWLLSEEVKRLKGGNYYDPDLTADLTQQLSEISAQVDLLPQELEAGIKELSRSAFSIALFGRTTAGKSTLHEILKHGSGKSIGHGGQRTTRDVRTYYYKSLKITDVPGIGAFEGKEDEDLAFEAARKCDLVLFLITDDAPQSSEADCLKKILAYGKPVICLINLKVAVRTKNGTSSEEITPETPIDFEFFADVLEEKFDPQHVENIQEQFIEFGEEKGQDWRAIPFTEAHLRAAFLSQKRKTPEEQALLWKLSHFTNVEKAILEEVCKNGKFHKLRAFIDKLTVPLVDTTEILLEQSVENLEHQKTLEEKRVKVNDLKKQFLTHAENTLEAAFRKMKSDLHSRVPSFAEEYLERKDINQRWKALIDEYNITQKTEKEVKALCERSTNDLKAICREIASEVKFSHENFIDQTIERVLVFNYDRWLGWAGAGIATISTIVGIFVASNPLGWIAGAVGVVVGLGVAAFRWFGSKFGIVDSREEKLRKERKKLIDRLEKTLDKIFDGLHKRVHDAIRKDVLEKQYDMTEQLLEKFGHSLAALSKSQHDVACLLNERIIRLNRMLIEEALTYAGHQEILTRLKTIGRIPGYAMQLVFQPGGALPEAVEKELSDLMKETVWSVTDEGDLKRFLAQAIGEDPALASEISIDYKDQKPWRVHLPVKMTKSSEEKTKSSEEKTKSSEERIKRSTFANRVRLAQQISGLLITK